MATRFPDVTIEQVEAFYMLHSILYDLGWSILDEDSGEHEKLILGHTFKEFMSPEKLAKKINSGGER